MGPAGRRTTPVKISPLDVRKQTFRTVFRGADSEEVRVFLDLVATEYENALQETHRLSERLHQCEERLVEYRELDQLLRNSLLTAERVSVEAKESSHREAEMILQEAEWRAKQILEDARERLGRLAEEIRDLQSKKDAFSQHLRSFLQAQMDLLDRNEEYLTGIDRLADDIHEMASRARQAAGKPSTPQPGPASNETPGSGKWDLFDATAPATFDDEDLPDSIPLEERAPSASESVSRGREHGPGRSDQRVDRREPEDEESEEPTPEASRRLAEQAEEGLSSRERSEGLFEISAEEEDLHRS
jgi:cell division initiation protein